MAGSHIATGFGLRDVAIATMPEAPGDPTWVDIPSVESAAFQMNVEEVEQYGDDKYQGTYYHSQKGTITVRGNKMSMQVFEMLSGNSVNTSGDVEQIYFGTEKELLPPRVMVRALVPIRRDDGTTGAMTVYWFNCDVKTVWDSLPGGERANLAEVNLVFNSYSSTKDERGDAIPSDPGSAFGRFEF